MDYKISVPFVFPPIAQFVPQCVDRVFDSYYPLSKVTKVALCSLGLFVAALYCVKTMLARRTSPPATGTAPATANLDLSFPKEIVELLGGEEAFKTYRWTFLSDEPTSQGQAPIVSSSRLGGISFQLMRWQSKNRELSPPAISLGKDKWGCHFARIGFINHNRNDEKGYRLIHSIQHPEKVVWYVDNEQVFPAQKDAKENPEGVTFIQDLLLKKGRGFQLDQGTSTNL